MFMSVLKRRAVVALVALATVGVGIGTMAVQAQAAGSTHHVMISSPTAARSVFYSTVSAFQPFTACRPLRPHQNGQWVDGRQDVIKGQRVTIITFTSDDCSSGPLRRFEGRGPRDNLDNWWVRM